MTSNQEFSSDRVDARRASMLTHLLGEMEQLHRRRRTRRQAILVATPLIVIAFIAFLANMQTPSPPSIGPAPIANHLSTRKSAEVIFVKTDPTILGRYTAVSQPKAEIISDDALIASLAELNVHTGLVRSEGKTWLTAKLPADLMTSPGGT